MNSQQELLNAINSIAQNKNRSYDTPAEVLRVEGDTVWVHIDGGADETPVLKTINCEQGEKVQVRIANGNAFLVGNASAPPTDDKRANKAYFIAEQADINAGTAIRSVNAISQTVEGKVDTGDSNIEVLSSTMYQNANGVNVFNGSLAVGDSYAHIDGDSFDIKEVTTAGQIDDANDPVLASFNGTETVIGKGVESYQITLNPSSGIELGYKGQYAQYNGGWSISNDNIVHIGGGGTGASTHYGHLEMEMSGDMDSAKIEPGYARFYIYNNGDNNDTHIDGPNITCYKVTVIDNNAIDPEFTTPKVILDSYGLKVQYREGIRDSNNKAILDGWTPTATVSSNIVTFSGLSDSYGYDLYCEDKLIGISSCTKTGSGSNVTLSFVVTGASNGDVCKLRILR